MENFAKKYRDHISALSARGIVSAVGLSAFITTALGSVPETTAGAAQLDRVKDRLEALQSIVSSLDTGPASVDGEGRIPTANERTAQWGNWQNWGNYFTNWNKPWGNWVNQMWGNY